MRPVPLSSGKNFLGRTDFSASSPLCGHFLLLALLPCLPNVGHRPDWLQSSWSAGALLLPQRVGCLVEVLAMQILRVGIIVRRRLLAGDIAVRLLAPAMAVHNIPPMGWWRWNLFQKVALASVLYPLY